MCLLTVCASVYVQSTAVGVVDGNSKSHQSGIELIILGLQGEVLHHYLMAAYL